VISSTTDDQSTKKSSLGGKVEGELGWELQEKRKDVKVNEEEGFSIHVHFSSSFFLMRWCVFEIHI